MHDLQRQAELLTDRFGKMAGERDRAMSTARASNRNRNVTSAFPLESRQAKLQEARCALDEAAAVLGFQHVVTHPVVETRQGPQLGNEVWILQEAHVENQIGVHRRPKFEPERYNPDVDVRQ